MTNPLGFLLHPLSDKRYDDRPSPPDVTRADLPEAGGVFPAGATISDIINFKRNPLDSWYAVRSGKFDPDSRGDLQDKLSFRHSWRDLPLKERIARRDEIIKRESNTIGIPERLARAITDVESWTAQPWAVGNFGEIGLFQINPRVHSPDSVKKTTGDTDLSNPETNARFGISLLKNLSQQHDKWSDVVRGYNGKFDDPETDRYLLLVARQLIGKNRDADNFFNVHISSISQAAQIIDSILPPISKLRTR